MELRNIKSLNINGDVISNFVNTDEKINTCDTSNSIASVNVLKQLILKTIYPIGSVYINNKDETNPNKILGFGTWERISGRYIYAAESTTERDGGEDYITSGMIPQHKHQINISTDEAGLHTHKIYYKYLSSHDDRGHSEHLTAQGTNGNRGWYAPPLYWTISYNGEHSHALNCETETPDLYKRSKNLPSYMSFYIWVRIN